MKILISESSKAMGGQERAVLLHAEGLQKRGHQVRLILEPDSPIYHMALGKPLNVQLVSMAKHRYPGAIASFRNILRREQPDILHMNSSRDSWIGTIASRVISHRPGLIRTRHISIPLNKNFTTRLLYQKLLDAVIVSGGERTRQGLIIRDGLEAEKVFSFPIGVDVSEFCPGPPEADLRKELGLPSKQCLIGIISYLRHYKGHEFFIKAAELVLAKETGVTFVMVGTGPEEEVLRSMIASLGLEKQILMLGFRDDLLNVFRSLNIFVIPSVEADTIPQVVMQAFAVGLPVVSTEIGSIPDVVRNGETGYVVPPRNTEALARRILDLVTSPDHGLEMGSLGRNLLEKEYSLDRMLDRLEAVYQKVSRHG